MAGRDDRTRHGAHACQAAEEREQAQQNKKNFKAPKLEQTEKLLGIGSEQPKPENKTVQTKAAKAPAANPKSNTKVASTNSKNKDKVNFLAK